MERWNSYIRIVVNELHKLKLAIAIGTVYKSNWALIRTGYSDFTTLLGI